MRECVAQGQEWHVTCWHEGTPQHHPKRSQAKHPPIVAYPCWPLHDCLDNGGELDGLRLQNEVVNGEYRIYIRGSREILLEVPSL